MAVALAPGPAPAAADAPDAVTPLPAWSASLDPRAHEALRRRLAAGGAAQESLRGAALDLAMGPLSPLERACRSGLLSKDAEPGSPWLAWRALGRAVADSCVWYLAALSCTDSLCGSALVPHDRLALLCVAPARSRLFLLPAEAARIGDHASRVDSVSVFRAPGRVVVQARRITTSEHPCWDGPHVQRDEAACFAVLRGDSLAQSFALATASASADHDDVEGDSGTDVSGALRADASAIRLERRIETWREVPGDDAAPLRREVWHESVRLAYRDDVGRFVAEE
jgi:hypothetical protein